MKNERQILAVTRWTARIVGTLILLLIAIFAIGDGVPNPFILSPREILLFAAIAMMLVGQIVAWKWEGIGGLLILGGFAFFSVVNHRISFNIVFGPWLLTGLIYLGCWCMKSKGVRVRLLHRRFDSFVYAEPAHLHEQPLSIALATMLVGLIVIWKWEGIGGLLILGGLASLPS